MKGSSQNDKQHNYDVIVCGAGHAGCEAALSAARRKMRVLLLTGNLDTIAQMSCNPAIGGLGKGHIVREIDALGGEMGLNADTTGIQFRLLNASKGPAVQGPRAQCDKRAYQSRMKHRLEASDGVTLFQAMVEGLLVKGDAVAGVRCNFGLEFRAKTVIVTTGTFLRALLHVGDSQGSGGRMGDFAAQGLSADFLKFGIELERFKTGTPPRILGSSIDFSQCTEQPSDGNPSFFAFYDTRFGADVFHVEQFQEHPNLHQELFHVEQIEAENLKPRLSERENKSARQENHSPEQEPCQRLQKPCQSETLARFLQGKKTEKHEKGRKSTPHGYPIALERMAGWLPGSKTLSCWETATNATTEALVRDNLEASPLHKGIIQGTGPRYCPSIEDKVVRFAHRTHRLFLEPEGLQTREWYINGLSTSLPLSVQKEILQSIPGMQNAHITRPAYAVEYDFAPPTQLWPSLESRKLEGLFFAGQINGSSGYEEAAAQGLIAGINASSKVLGQSPLILGRHEAYIGVLIDDLVNKGTDEPYRMFTNRAEHRLLLNHGSAELRILEHAKHFELVPKARLKRMQAKSEQVEHWVAILERERPPSSAATFAESLRQLSSVQKEVELPSAFAREFHAVQEEVLYRIRYRGYLEREQRRIEKMRHWAKIRLPETLDYNQISGLRKESAEKLSALRPLNLAQAQNVSGVSPSDLSTILVFVKSRFHH